MDVGRILAELKAERDQIVDAIGKLETLAQGCSKRRGRPPSWRTIQAAAPAAKRRGRPPGSKNKARPPDADSPSDSGVSGASGS